MSKPNFDELENVEKGQEVEESEDNNDEMTINENDMKEVKGSLQPQDPNYMLKCAQEKVIIERMKRKFPDETKPFQSLISDQIIDGINDLEQLKLIKDKLKIAIGCRGSKMLIESQFKSMVGIMEAFSPKIGMNFSGLSKVINQNPEIDKLLEEISLQNMEYTDPYHRLLFTTLQIALAVNQVHKSQKQQDVQVSRKPTKKPAMPNLKIPENKILDKKLDKKYEDI